MPLVYKSLKGFSIFWFSRMQRSRFGEKMEARAKANCP